MRIPLSILPVQTSREKSSKGTRNHARPPHFGLEALEPRETPTDYAWSSLPFLPALFGLTPQAMADSEEQPSVQRRTNSTTPPSMPIVEAEPGLGEEGEVDSRSTRRSRLRRDPAVFASQVSTTHDDTSEVKDELNPLPDDIFSVSDASSGSSGSARRSDSFVGFADQQRPTAPLESSRIEMFGGLGGDGGGNTGNFSVSGPSPQFLSDAEEAVSVGEDLIAAPLVTEPLAPAQTQMASMTSLPSEITLNATVRDFMDSHPDFEGSSTGLTTGLVESTLGSDDDPVFAGPDGSGAITSSATFDQWYEDVAGVNTKTTLPLTLTETSAGSGIYGYSSNSFFPIDNQLFGNEGRSHNFHFTLELDSRFTYRGGETFSFTGDDDLWVFVNDELVVDLGGVHGAASGSVDLDTLGLTLGETYSFDLFFAERHTTQSNFQIETSIELVTEPPTIEGLPALVNDDVITDLIQLDGINDEILVRLADEDGQLGKPQRYASGGAAPSAVVTGDLIGDWRTDIAIGHTDGSVTFLENVGAGTFQPRADLTVTGLGVVTSIAAEDFDSDGDLDLIVNGTDRVIQLVNDHVAPASAIVNGDFSEGTTGWTTTTSVDVDNEVAWLNEDDTNLLTTISQEFVVPGGATTLSFDLLSLGLDPQEDGSIPDAFEASLLESSTNVSLVPTIGSGTTSFFNANPDDETRMGSGVTVADTRITLDVSGLAAGTVATLYFDLIGNPSDKGSAAAIDNVELLPLDVGQEGFSAITLTAPAGITGEAATGDVDSDTFADAVVADDTGALLAVYLGDGAGVLTYTDPATLTAGEQTAASELFTNDTTRQELLIEEIPDEVGRFFVVDSATASTFHYDTSGNLLTETLLGTLTQPRGVTSNSTGSTRWTASQDGTVLVTQRDGTILAEWTATEAVDISGIATDETNLWLLDAGRGRVDYFEERAATINGSHTADGGFLLDAANASPSGITTDGSTIWISDDVADAVFLYDTAGTLLGQWTLDGANLDASGLTLNPAGVALGSTELWVVDRADAMVYYYEAGLAQLNGSLSATGTFNLAVGNASPEGIADPVNQIGLDERVFDLISVAGELDEWSFSASTGQQILVQAALGSDKGFHLQLASPTGNVLIDGPFDSSGPILLNETGDFTLTVSGNAVGEYAFRIWEVESGENPPAAALVEYDGLVDASTSSVAVFSNTTFQRQDDELLVDMLSANIGSERLGPVVVAAVDRVAPATSSLVNPADIHLDGRPIVAFAGDRHAPGLIPGSVSETHTIRFTSSDGLRFTPYLDLLAPDNSAPVFTSSPIVSVQEGSTYTYPPSVVDYDDDPLRFSLLSTPSGLDIDPDTGELFWAPAESDLGRHSVEILVEDGRGGAARQAFTVQVNPSGNADPTFTSLPNALSVLVDSQLSAAVIADDTDGDMVSYAILDGPSGLVIGQNTGVLSWAPSAAELGEHTVTVLAVDGRGGSATANVSIEVISVPSASISGVTFYDKNGDGSQQFGDLLVASRNTDSISRFSIDAGAYVGLAVPVGFGGLNGPNGIAVGPDGYLYANSADPDQVLRFDLTTTSALSPFGSGVGMSVPNGLAFGPSGDLYVADFQIDQIIQLSGQDGSLVRSLSHPALDGPGGITLGPDGFLYVGGYYSDNVLKLDPELGVAVPFVASGSGGLNGVKGLTFGPSGDLFVSSSVNSHILRFDAQSGAFIESFASGSGLGDPFGIEFGPDGHLYVGNHAGNNVLKFDGTTGDYLATLDPVGSINYPTFLTVSPESEARVGHQGVFIDTNNNGIRDEGEHFTTTNGSGEYRFDGLAPGHYAVVIETSDEWHANSTSTQILVVGTGESSIADFALSREQLVPPGSISGSVFDDKDGDGTQTTGDLLVASRNTDSVSRFDIATGAYTDLAVPVGFGGLNAPNGVAIGPDGYLYVNSADTDEVLRYDLTTGSALGSFGSNAGLSVPNGLAFDLGGEVYVADYQANQVIQLSGIDGSFVRSMTFPELSGPGGITLGPDGCLYVGGYASDNVLKLDPATGTAVPFVTSGSGGLDGVAGLTFGPSGDLFVASSLNNRVLRYDGASGHFVDVFAFGGGMGGPFGLAFGPDRHLYVANRSGNNVLKFDGRSGVHLATLDSGGTINYPTFLTMSSDSEWGLLNRVVFLDSDGDGLRGEGEVFTFTDEFGHYAFEGLAPGDYVVAVEAEYGWQPTGSSTKVVSVSSGQDTTTEFGSQSIAGIDPASIEGHVFNDRDGDGQQNGSTLLVSSSDSDSVTSFDAGTGEPLGALFSVRHGGIWSPHGLSYGPDGNLYVSDAGNDRVLRYTPSGTFLDVFASGGGLDSSHGLVFGSHGVLYVAGFLSDDVHQFDATTGAWLGNLSLPSTDGTSALAFGPDGWLYIAGFASSNVLRYDPVTGVSETFVASGSGGLHGADGLTFGQDGNLYVASRYTDNVLRYDGLTGTFLDTFATGGGLADPFGLDFGPDGDLYVSNRGSDNVLRYDGQSGQFLGVFATGGIDRPTYLLFPDTAEGSLEGWTVFLDYDGDGRRDFNESWTLTDRYGQYVFPNLQPGNYTVALEAPPLWLVTTPSSGRYTHSLIAGQTVNTDNFGLRFDEGASSNQPPMFSGTPETVSVVGDLYTYSPSAIDPEGQDVYLELLAGPAGMVLDEVGGTLSWVPVADQVGPHDVTVRAYDEIGDWSDLTITVTAYDGLTIDSQPVQFAMDGQPYAYAVTVVDPSDQVLQYYLDDAPGGMSIDIETGLLEWMPTSADVGSNLVTVRVANGGGRDAYQSFSLKVLASTELSLIGNPPTTNTAGEPYRYRFTAEGEIGPVDFELVESPSTMTIDSRSGILSWFPDLSDIGGHVVTVRAHDEFGRSDEVSYSLEITADVEAPSVSILTSKALVGPDEVVTIEVIARDNLAVSSLIVTSSGIPISLDAQNQAELSFAMSGVQGVSATAVDAAGNEAVAFQTIRVFDPADTTPPVVTITSPQPGDTITYLTDVVGTVTDDNLEFVELALADYSALGRIAPGYIDLSFKTFARIEAAGQTTIDGVLGTIDPTILENDGYVLRVLAQDVNGLIWMEHLELSVEGNAKIGHFTMSVTDLEVPLAGIPITVGRTYDTRQADDAGDFGFGWTLDIADGEIRETVRNVEAERTSGLFGATPFRIGTRVYLTGPDGERGGYTFDPVPEGGALGTLWRPRFIADPGVFHELSVDPVPLQQSADGTFALYLFGLNWNPSVYTLTTKDGTEYRYDQFNGLQTVTARTGVTLTYTDEGIFSSVGESILFERDALGRITAVIDPAGNRITYAYNGAGELVSVTDQESNVTSYSYLDDPLHYLDEVIDDDCGCSSTVPSIRNEYDEQGRISNTYDALGYSVTSEYDLANNTEIIGDRLGNETTLIFDDRGNIIQEIDPEGHSTSYTYDADGNELTVTNGRGFTTTQTYDDRGNVLTVTDHLSNVTTFTYDSFSRLLTAEDALGATIQYIYDSSGHLIETIDQAGHSSLLAYDTFGRITQTTNPSGFATTYTYSDPSDRPSQITDDDGSQMLMEYNVFGNRVHLTDQLGFVTTWEYDKTGLPVLIRNRNGEETRLEYTIHNQVSRVTDSLGNETTFEYDDNGNVISDTDATGAQRLYSYDRQGNIVELTDRNLRTTTFTYDKNNRLTSESWRESDGTLVNELFWGYDEVGNVLTTSDNFSSLSYTYDELDRVLSEDNLGTPNAPNVVLTYTYDAIGDRLTVSDNSGVVVTSTYDERQLPISYTWAGAGLDDVRVELAYDESRHLEDVRRFSDASGVTLVGRTHYGYDNAGRTETIDHTDALDNVLTGYTYEYNLASQVVRSTHHGNAYDYQYDDFGQITEVFIDSILADTFAYDDNGNRSDVDTIIGANNELLEDAEFLYVYDAEGNLVEKTLKATGETTSYAYDHRNRLLRTTISSSGGVILHELTYVYDTSGRRITEIRDGNVEHHTYNELNTWADFNTNGTILARYLIGEGIDELLARWKPSEGVSWYLTDRLGTVHDLVNHAGQVINHIDYNAFGTPIAQTNALSGDRFLFTGREFEPLTGGYNFRFREYNPTTGRFLSRDPLGFGAGDTNLYRYVGNSPLSAIDPLGLAAMSEKAVHKRLQALKREAVKCLGQYLEGVFIDSAVQFAIQGITGLSGQGVYLWYNGEQVYTGKTLNHRDRRNAWKSALNKGGSTLNKHIAIRLSKELKESDLFRIEQFLKNRLEALFPKDIVKNVRNPAKNNPWPC
ncbi:tRNA3(Ser)-specific nuclease WapA precursor [Planctomycetes bacterium Pan216]|uniref:tRNA3(Ser)-specific nuclease WapA n=1 Tax=Kolteria novifilia TaxID=2527975 RepID=A0A518AY09_9BACT|nr:tRNA3(Ser)-specific nuclease WapA precursor [Planctomycetes bacterium Pan216]